MGHASNTEVMMRRTRWCKWYGPIGLAACLSGAAVSGTRAEPQNYDYGAAVQEITQLFWLAETASACGWASADDASKFKLFSLRFLSAHMSGVYRTALLSMVAENGYEDRVRLAARDGAVRNCDSARWRGGWLAYKAAADAHDAEF
jgi:hypothetical protein